MYEDGLHSNRVPGCYVILVYKGRIASRKPESYLKGYVGQSVNVFRRVHKHLSGGGNANIFEDVKAGRRVMVQIVPCSSDSLNDMERLLIAAMEMPRQVRIHPCGQEAVIPLGLEACRSLQDAGVVLRWQKEDPPGNRRYPGVLRL